VRGWWRESAYRVEVVLKSEKSTIQGTGDVPQNFEIRSAQADEVGTVASILEEVALWASSKDFLAWEPGLFAEPDGVGQAWIRSDIHRGTQYLIWCDDAAVGTFVLRTRDELFWPGADDDALYLHRFAVLHVAAGVGRRAIEWMMEETRREGRTCVRLDCLAENEGIRRYYVGVGFCHRGDLELEAVAYSLYERRVEG
jgi:hypothetical protein